MNAFFLCDVKNFFSLFALLVAFLSFSSCHDAGVEPIVTSTIEFKGYSYTSFNTDGFTQGNTLNAVNDLLLQSSNTWIALCVFEFQSTPTSADIAPNTTYKNPVTNNGWYATSTEQDIRNAVRAARDGGMHIMLKPHLDLYTGEWRATITPDAQGKWFAAYTTMIKKYAMLAEELHIEMLCLGVELVNATQKRYENNWRTLIADVRKVYSGKLVYAANWSSANGGTQTEFEQIEFWNDVDYIGIDTYFPLANTNDAQLPTFSDAVARMQQPIYAIKAISEKFGKRVILAELGCQSVRGALAAPYDYAIGNNAAAVPDNDAQTLFYRVIIETLGRQSYCAGMFWWNWESVRSANEATNYTCRNKPAVMILKQFYSSVL